MWVGGRGRGSKVREVSAQSVAPRDGAPSPSVGRARFAKEPSVAERRRVGEERGEIGKEGGGGSP